MGSSLGSNNISSAIRSGTGRDREARARPARQKMGMSRPFCVPSIGDRRIHLKLMCAPPAASNPFCCIWSWTQAAQAGSRRTREGGGSSAQYPIRRRGRATLQAREQKGSVCVRMDGRLPMLRSLLIYPRMISNKRRGVDAPSRKPPRAGDGN
ncbi:hypothetical protein FKP32DRAFT_668266 [Trametes sanguinea]|nr:hypothetical protein FKP32DRAFT_668266 [Trametes sanguinea]